MLHTVLQAMRKGYDFKEFHEIYGIVVFDPLELTRWHFNLACLNTKLFHPNRPVLHAYEAIFAIIFSSALIKSSTGVGWWELIICLAVSLARAA